MLVLYRPIHPPIVYEYIKTLDPSLLKIYFDYVNDVFGKGFRVVLETGDNAADIVNDLLESVIYEDLIQEYEKFETAIQLQKPKLKEIIKGFRTGYFFSQFDETSLYSEMSDDEFTKEFQSAHDFYKMIWHIAKGDVSIRGFSLEIFSRMIRFDLIQMVQLQLDLMDSGTIRDAVISVEITNEEGIIASIEVGHV